MSINQSIDPSFYRFVREKAEYKGPWVVPKRRAKKHPLAPKRPMSAFLKYSQKRRSAVKEQNPDMSNTDVSRLLGEMWRNASSEERAPYVEQEELERAQYKAEIKKWRQEQAKADAASRASHRTVVTASLMDQPPPPAQLHSPSSMDDYYSAVSGFEPVHPKGSTGMVDERMYRPVPVSKSKTQHDRSSSAPHIHSSYIPSFYQASYQMPYRPGEMMGANSRLQNNSHHHSLARSHVPPPMSGVHADYVLSAPGSTRPPLPHPPSTGELPPLERMGVYRNYAVDDGKRGDKRSNYFSDSATPSFGFYHYP